MKKTLYLCLCAIIVLTLNTTKAIGQTLSGYRSYVHCTSLLDTAAIEEIGYTPLDSLVCLWGDGTSDTIPPVWVSGSMAEYGPGHTYGMLGTYSAMLILRSGGANVDTYSYVMTFNPCNIIQVNLYYDRNSNCIHDAGDSYLNYGYASVEIDSAGVPIDTVSTNYAVGYKALGPVGTVYTFKVIHTPHGFKLTCPTTGVISLTVTGIYGYYVGDIGFECDPTACYDNSIFGYSSAGLTGARAGAYVLTSSCTSTSATVKLSFSPKYAVVSAYGAPYTVSGNVITYTISSFSQASPQWLLADFAPTTTLTMGDTVNTRFEVISPVTDCDATNDIVNRVDTIRASYDPNHKSVTPEGAISPAGAQLEYTLQFENTGNDTAYNIHLQDTLSDNLDINTIKQLASSAQCNMLLSKWAGHNVVKFDFPNIKLPDSSKRDLCHGMVVFTIRSKAGLPAGTAIDNRVGIYFDANEVVMTNTAHNFIPIPTGVANVISSKVEVYPNPVREELTVNLDNNTYSSITINNMLGQTVLTQQLSAKQTKVNVKTLPAGIYYLTVKGNNGMTVQKFEKL